MANLPGNIYAGGAVTLNSTPYVQYYLQSKAREQAKKEAIDKFYMDMGKSLTPTGVYSNDIPLFIDKKNQWQQHAMDNKDILNNPRHPQYAEKVAENSYLYNDAASIPELSKSKVKNFQEYMSAVKPNMKNVTEDTIEYGSKILAPLGQNAPLDLTRISYTPELFDAKNQDAFIKTAMSNVKPDRTFGEPKIDAKSHQVINPYTDAYSTEGKQKIATNAALVYDNDKAAQAYFENEFHEHDADYENFNKAFKEYFKRDIASPKDAAIGWALSHAGVEEKGEQRAAYNPYLGINVSSGGGNNVAGGGNAWVSEVVGAFKGGDKQTVKNAIGKLFAGNGTYELEPDAYGVFDNNNTGENLVITARPRGLTEKGRKKPAEQIVISKDDTNLSNKLLGWYQRLTGSDAKGEKAIIGNSTNTAPPKQAAKKSYNVNGKSYSHDALINMGYTEDQIQEAIKLGTIK